MEPEKKTRTRSKPQSIFKINIANLLKLKSLITLVLVLTTAYAALKAIELPEEFKMITMSVVTYYFSKQENTSTKK